MFPYIVITIGVVYLVSMILQFRKVSQYKRKYIRMFGIALFLDIIMGILGILFPVEASSRFAMYTSIIALVIIGGLSAYATYRIKKINNEFTKK